MSMTDPIADLLTRLRNASRARLATVTVPASRLKRALAEVLKEEGYLEGVVYKEDGLQGMLTLQMKYGAERMPVITDIRRISKPGLRRYVACRDIVQVRNGLGVSILSTSKGVLVDRDARKQGVGGELLATIW